MKPFVMKVTSLPYMPQNYGVIRLFHTAQALQLSLLENHLSEGKCALTLTANGVCTVHGEVLDPGILEMAVKNLDPNPQVVAEVFSIDVAVFTRTLVGSMLVQHLLSLDPTLLDAVTIPVTEQCVPLSSNQFGSHVVQRILELASTEQVAKLVHSIAAECVPLSSCKYGSHVVRKAMGLDVQEHVEEIARKLRDEERCLALCSDTYGNHVVQRLLDSAEDSTVDAVEAQLAPHCKQLAINKFGCHVLIKILRREKTEQLELIASHVLEECVQLCRNQFGSHVVQATLSLNEGNSCDSLKKIIESVLAEENFASICCNKFGTYVIQRLIRYGDASVISTIAERVRERYTEVCYNKHGFFAVEALLKGKHKQCVPQAETIGTLKAFLTERHEELSKQQVGTRVLSLVAPQIVKRLHRQKEKERKREQSRQSRNQNHTAGGRGKQGKQGSTSPHKQQRQQQRRGRGTGGAANIVNAVNGGRMHGGGHGSKKWPSPRSPSSVLSSSLAATATATKPGAAAVSSTATATATATAVSKIHDRKDMEEAQGWGDLECQAE